MNAAEKKQSAWIIRVQDKEYGPVRLEELREWKDEGRLIRENEVRAPGSPHWFRAEELVELFGDENEAPVGVGESAEPSTLGQILARTWKIYHAGFWQFLGLSALVIVPSICAQVSSNAVGSTANGAIDLPVALAGLFNFAMLVASLFAWPVYIAGIQIFTREFAGGHSASLREVIPQTLRFWTRIVGLCLLVYGAFLLLLVLAFGILAMITVGATSIGIILLALMLLVFQVWMFGRVFVNTLFWQQAAVLEDTGALASLRRSRDLACNRRDLPRWRRPSFRGSIIASIWCAFVIALTIGPQWSAITTYYHTLATLHDPQSIMDSLNNLSRTDGFVWPLVLAVIQAIFRPLLGIAFVLLYLDVKTPSDFRPND